MKQCQRKTIVFLAIGLLALSALTGCQKAYLKKGSPDCPPGTHLVVEYNNHLNLIFQECQDSNGRVQGKHFIRDPNGKLKMEGHYKDGRFHGKFTEWDENGKKMSETEFSNGIPSGTWLHWNKDGILVNITQFSTRDNKRMQLVLKGDGTKHSEGELGNQLIRNGKWKFWHENGQLKEEGQYVKHKKNGLWSQWDEKGNEIKRTYFENGAEVE